MFSRFATMMALATVLVAMPATVSAQKWSFGVMGDTQWTCATDPAGQNPSTVSVSIINQLNRQFIDHGVRLVIAVGDLTDDGSDAGIAVRALAAQQLQFAGIGFFPMRGNHETYSTTPNNYAIPAFRAAFPQTQGLASTFGARNFSSPTSVSTDLKGMSYSFDYGLPGSNVRFVIIDPWVTPSKQVTAAGYPYGYSIGEQQPWINSRLNARTRNTTHAFVFSHQPLMAEDHQDSPFTGYTNANPAMQNAFFASLQNNGVRYYISGHDHIHQRSLIASPDGSATIEELICSSDSSKFYTPKSTSDSNWFGQKTRETSLSQERYTVGYYIFTIDGPRVTVDYYSDDHGSWLSDASYPSGPTGSGTHVTPMLSFVKKETWGYSLNGKTFLVGQGKPYTVVSDRFGKTSATILAGTNNSTATDYDNRALTQSVSTGWSTPGPGMHNVLTSNILTLTGMSDVGSDLSSPYALAMSYDPTTVTAAQLKHGWVALATTDGNGNWTNAVNLNLGGSGRFVYGPWQAGYGLGTYGVDPTTHTAWAVINYTGDFATVRFRAK